MSAGRWSAATALLVAAATVLAWRTTQERSILGNHDRLLVEILAWWLVWAFAIACLRRCTGRSVVWVVLLGAVALRLAALTHVVPLSDDLYRYAWDGSVQAAGTNPYRYPPVAPELADLRTEWLFPGPPGCAAEPGCTRINRPSVRTIYPPLAQGWFLLGHVAGASQLRDLGWELLALVADIATVVLLWRVLVARHRDPRWVAVFAWSPVAVLEGVQNGHVDGLATLFVVAAVALAGRRPGWSGAALGAAAMIKLYPALLLPALLVRRPVRVVTAFAGVCALSYLPHLLVLGTDVLGYLPGYLQEEDYASGGRYLLLRPLGLGGPGATAVAGVLGAAVLAVVLARRRVVEPAQGALLLFGAALLIATPVQPWYGLPLAALAAMAGRAAWLAVPAAAYVAFFAGVPAGPSPAASRAGSLGFCLALVAVLLGAMLRRRARSASDRARA